MICTPASRAQEVGAALGAQAGEARLREVLTEAGFGRVRRAAQTPFNLVLEAGRCAAGPVRPRGGGETSMGHGATGATLAVVERFLEAFGRRDVDAVMDAMSDDCVFESTEPPDGRRHCGRAAVRRCREELFRTPGARFTTEEVAPSGDRATVRWRYSWGEGSGGGHVRGVDLFTVRDGVVVEKLSYVKG